MRYRDLVQFEPIESVIQLRQADHPDHARELVRTYVISDRMAEVMTDLLIPHLQFDRPFDHRGLMIVGNYGTGKSHLMSVLSAVAQWSSLRELVRHPVVAQALEPIAGRFQVLRMEVGTTQMPLRDIVLKERLEPFLRQLGIEFTFPSMAETSNTKDPLLAAMSVFQERCPEQGLLILVDELLDYLRGRREQELILDLSFLREVGEVCRLGRLRFVAGLQEALFDSPRFQFAADALRRVRDRFEQVRITREDVAFVVAERLLRKTEEQKAWIRAHLQKFTQYYGDMAERLEDFVRLFPVHPTYLEVFERITFAEQRVALKAISQTMRSLLDQEVPSDQPGLTSYDSYWPLLVADPSFRSSPEIREVVDKSRVLSDRIAHAYTRPQYRPIAERLIRALSVLRLTTGDIYAPIGATAEELRDGLAIFDPSLPEQDADFLRDVVDTALREMIRTVSGQFISVNPENGQYYLDLKKDIDYDARIAERADTLEADLLNRYYFEALRELLGQDERTYVPGHRIWEYEVPWPERRVTRPGYLFFGTPNERSTAQPPRDFYLYFLQPFEMPPFEDERKPDEVFFRLREWDEAFEQALRTFAGAWEMSLTSSGVHQQVYRGKADRAKQELMRWIRAHPDMFTVTHQGESRPFLQWERKGVGSGPEPSFREMVQGIAAACLTPYFEETYPDYPAFRSLRQPITRESRPRMVQDALRCIVGPRVQSGMAVLDGLGLLDDEGQVRPERSPYARYIMELLNTKGPSAVLNRNELIEPWMGDERMRRFQIEPEYLAVLLVALVYAGEVEIVLPAGRKLDAATLDEVLRMSLDDLLNFRHVARPRELPLSALKAVMELLELPPGLIQNPDTREMAVGELQKRVTEELERVVKLQNRVRQGLSLWGRPVLEGETLERVQASLKGYKEFLESLRPFNTPGKLRNFPHTAEAIREEQERRARVRQIEQMTDQIERELQPLTAYLREAATILPKDHSLRAAVQKAQEDHLTALGDPLSGPWTEPLDRIHRELMQLKVEYTKAYQEAHRQARLDSEEDRRKNRLLQGPRMKRLHRLAESVPILPRERLKGLEGRLGALIACWRLIPSDLEREPICPHCHFRPDTDAPDTPPREVLQEADGALDRWTREWVDILSDALSTPTAQQSLALMSPEERGPLEALRDHRSLPDPLDEPFLQTLAQTLQGLERVTLLPEDILQALTLPGMPCTVEDLRQRFERLLQERLAGKDPARVRVVIDW